MPFQNGPKTLYAMRKQPKQKRSKATINVILAAAARVLMSEGYDKASTNKIAEAAGVSIGSLYEYFPSKEAIYAEVRRYEDRKLYLETMSAEVPQSIKELLHLHVSVYLKFVRSNLKLHSALINDVPQFAITREELPFYRDYIPWVTGFLRLHVDELRSENDIIEMAEFATRATRATIDNYVLYSPDILLNPGIESQLVDFLERYLLK